MKKLIILFVLALFLGGISALCEEGQININTATVEELTGIKHIADKRANEIIELRTEKLFEFVDDLVRVSGIVAGGSRLSDIKQEELACVDKETNEIEEEEEEIEDKKIIEEEEKTIEEEEVIEDEEKQEPEMIYNKEADKKENIELNTIKLKAKSIKRENDNENPDKSNYANVWLCNFLHFTWIFVYIKEKEKL